MKRLLILTIAAAIIGSWTSPSYGQVKWAQTGFNFLSVTSDARAGAMGDAVNSLSAYGGALFHNPATMADMTSTVNASFSTNSWIADIKHLQASVIASPWEGEYGVIGFSLQAVNYGDLQGTMVWNNDKGYIDTQVFTPTALALGVGYAKMISANFGVGAQVRFAYQNLGQSVVPDNGTLITKQNVAKAVAFDFGTLFKTGVKSLAFGMSVRNFSKEVKFEQEGFQLPLLFTVGISANVFDFFDFAGADHALLVSLDSTHPRAHPEQIKVGMEYEYMKLIAFRGGYTSANSEDAFTFGVGVSSAGLNLSSVGIGIDYSYTPFGVFGSVQRITASLSM